eukprot:TRINITY_DN17967_c0_g1_i1.p1 TRINITY_DN17967_c0_g1~~TRINITY_DN17967_c0_g1_i1.p1  ORF type:complete len:612 (-),score=93.21 TRINITY_DN17967_c0_g1_i1:174-2009(-)
MPPSPVALTLRTIGVLQCGQFRRHQLGGHGDVSLRRRAKAAKVLRAPHRRRATVVACDRRRGLFLARDTSATAVEGVARTRRNLERGQSLEGQSGPLATTLAHPERIRRCRGTAGHISMTCTRYTSRRMSRFPQFWGRVKKTTFPMMALSIASRCFNKPPLQPLYQLPDHAILVSESDDASQTQLQPQPPSGVRPPCARPGRAAVSSSLNRDGADGEAADMKSFRREKVDVGASRQRLENEDYRLLVEWCEKKRMHLYKLFRTLDVDKSMNVSRREFQKGMKDLRYPSDIDKLWSYLDNDTTGTISFLEFMPREALDMARFKAWSLENFGNMKATFDAMDTNGNGRVNWTEFDKVCTEKGLHSRLQGSIESLYKLFDVDAKGTGGAATVDDFLLLDAWKPPEYLWAEPNVQAREKFQAELFRRYNHNPIMAWRRALDTDSSMRVNYDEFAAACRKLNRAGFDCARLAGGIGRLFTAYDVERNGYFSLRDFDGNAFRLLAMFSVWVFRQSDRVSNWIRSLEETPNEGVSLTAFRQAVKSMALDTEDMEQLFEGLSLEKVSRGAGVTKAGRITVQEAIFLDRWNPAQDCGDDECWSRILAAVRSPPLTQTAEK